MQIQRKSRLSIGYFEKTYPTYMGYVYAILTNILLVFGNLFIQNVSKNFTSNQVLYFVGVQLASYSFITTKHNKVPTCHSTPRITRMLILRAVLGFSGAIFFYKGMSVVPLAEGTVVQMLTPIITGILALLFLKEKYDITLLLSTIFSVIGVLFVNKPGFLFGETVPSDKSYPDQTFGLFLLLVSSFLGSISQVILKKLGSVSNPFTTSFYLGIGFSISASIAVVLQGIKNPSLSVYIWLPMLGLVRFLIHALMGKSYAFGDAGKISLISYAQVPIAFIVDIFIVGRNPDLYSILGSFSVFSSVFIMLYKHYKQGNLVKK